jgi:hypothetical protein
MTTEAPAIVFYDHSMNMTNKAVGMAMARVRRECIADGTAYRVEATPRSGKRFYWDGGRYDCIQLAKQLSFNRYGDVTLTDASGKSVDIENATY